MALKEKISADLIQALKNKESLRLETFRFLLAVIHNQEIEKKSRDKVGDLSDDEITSILNREAKKRKEANQLYNQGGRPDLAQKELAELKIIQVYLPTELSEAEIRKIIRETIVKINVGGEKDFGRAMGETMKLFGGRADASLVAGILREEIGAVKENN